MVTDTSMLHSESEPEGELDPQDVFDEWMLGLKTTDRKMLATCLFVSFQKRQKMSVVDDASITGFNERTVRAYAKEFNVTANRSSFRATVSCSRLAASSSVINALSPSSSGRSRVVSVR